MKKRFLYMAFSPGDAQPQRGCSTPPCSGFDSGGGWYVFASVYWLAFPISPSFCLYPILSMKGKIVSILPLFVIWPHICRSPDYCQDFDIHMCVLASLSLKLFGTFQLKFITVCSLTLLSCSYFSGRYSWYTFLLLYAILHCVLFFFEPFSQKTQDNLLFCLLRRSIWINTFY